MGVFSFWGPRKGCFLCGAFKNAPSGPAAQRPSGPAAPASSSANWLLCRSSKSPRRCSNCCLATSAPMAPDAPDSLKKRFASSNIFQLYSVQSRIAFAIPSPNMPACGNVDSQTCDGFALHEYPQPTMPMRVMHVEERLVGLKRLNGAFARSVDMSTHQHFSLGRKPSNQAPPGSCI